MSAWFKQPLTTLAFAWRIERRDGVALGFTSHDRDLVIAGLVYAAAPGMLPSAIERSDSLDPDDVKLSGVLTSEAFSEDDLIAGRWDGAALWLSAVDWTQPETDPVLLVRGELGEVEIRDGAFSVGLRGPAAIFERAVVEETSPECRATLGDKRCRVDLSGRRGIVSVAVVSDATVMLAAAPGTDGAFAFGRLRWLEGANAGISAEIAASSGTVLTLREAPAFAVAPGTRAEITEGCDRRFSTCCARFANAVNFRGEPHLPGNDLLTRYGG